jgi:hypothetical protein
MRILLIAGLSAASTVAIVFTLIVAHWLYVDRRARRAYELRQHSSFHRFTPRDDCRLCERDRTA